MKLLITYDVSTVDKAGQKRLRRVARACEDYGTRVQKSVFECTVGETDWVRLRARLMAEMDVKQDSVRVYYLGMDIRIEHHGSVEPVDLAGPLIV